MQRLLTRTLAFCAMLLPAFLGAAHGQVSDQPIQHWPPILSDQLLPSNSTQSADSIYKLTLTPTFFALPVASPRLRDLISETDRPRTHGLLASTAWLKGSLVTETEVASNQGWSDSLRTRIPGDARNDDRSRMMRVGLTGTSGSVKYGMTYRQAGQAFYNAPDLALREAWGEWRNGFTALRTSFGQQWNNTAGDTSRSRMEQTYGRVGMTWNKPEWPNLALSYSKNSLSSTRDPLGVTPQRAENHTLEAALAYNAANWTARLASSYILGSDLTRNGAENSVKMQMLTALFRPFNTLTITPTLVYRSEQQDWSGVRIDTPSASLTMHYKQSRRLLISAVGNYTGTKSSDGLIDTENLGGKGVFAWDLQQTGGWATLISLEAGYNRMTNHVTPAADTEDISGLVKIVLASL